MTLLFRIEGAFAAMSMIGSFLVILNFIISKNLRQFPYTLVLYLSICDFFLSTRWAITSLLSNSQAVEYNIPIACFFQATAFHVRHFC